MCLIVFAWNSHPKYKLILAANRDEYYDRPTSTAGFWEDSPEILGGRDLLAGGSWMGISKTGRFAALTNYRDIKNIKSQAASRGEITSNYLTAGLSPENFIENLNKHARQYNGFNLLVSDFEQLIHYSNYEGTTNIIKPGVLGLSNALLDTPWPKVQLAKEKFSKIIEHPFSHDALLEMMGDETVAPDADLPDTGLPSQLEKALSAMCIRTERYGTCCSTVITVDRKGHVTFTERSYPVGNRKEETLNYEFQIINHLQNY